MHGIVFNTLEAKDAILMGWLTNPGIRVIINLINCHNKVMALINQEVIAIMIRTLI